MMEILDLVYSRIVEVGKTYQEDLTMSVLMPYDLLDPPTPTPTKIFLVGKDQTSSKSDSPLSAPAIWFITESAMT